MVEEFDMRPEETPDAFEARLGGTVDVLAELVRGFDPASFDGTEAARLVDVFAEGERLCAAGRTLAAGRVAECGSWRRDGDRSPAHWMARRTGSTVGAAVGTLETAGRLDSLPGTQQALRAGKLSTSQANEIASAAGTDPHAEAELLDAAQTENLTGPRDRCRRVKAAAAGPDESARTRAIHASRYLRHRTDDDGAFRLEARGTVEAGAGILAALEPFYQHIVDQARQAGQHQPYEASRFDALCALARDRASSAPAGTSEPVEPAQTTLTDQTSQPGETNQPEPDGPHEPGAPDEPGEPGEPSESGKPSESPEAEESRDAPESRVSVRSEPRAMIHVRVDYDALVRGHLEGGETCEVPGLGPIPIATARALMADAIIIGILTRGVDVTRVAHLGRTPTAAQRRALETRDPTCVVPGCANRERLEIDHVTGWAVTRLTVLDDLARLCSWHHHLKTHCGYRLHGPPGHWRWQPPDPHTATGPTASPGERHTDAA